MKDNYYVGAYWGPRPESASECSRRTVLFLNSLVRCDPAFVQWYRAGRGVPRGSPGHPVQIEVSALESLFEEKAGRTSKGKADAERLGFSQHFWNSKEDPVRISLDCGGNSRWGPSNSCILHPPMYRPLLQQPVTVSAFSAALLSVAVAWEPDFAMVSTTELSALVEQPRWEVRVGWLTYVSKRLGRLPPLPAPVRIEPVGELGWLLVLSEEPLSASNPEHVALAVRIRELLDRAGLIALPSPYPSGV